MHRSPLGRALQRVADNGPVRASEVCSRFAALKTPEPRTPAQHPPDPCQEPPPRVPIHPLSRSRPSLLPSSWDVEPVWSVLNSRLPNSRRFPFLHGLLSFFAAVELNSAAFRDVQLQAEAIDTQEDCARLPDSRSILSPNSRHHHSLAGPFRRPIHSFLGLPLRALSLLDDIARPSPPLSSPSF